MNDFLSGFDDWTVAFVDWSDVSISELHGIMTGVMTVCHAPDETGWIRLLEELSFQIPNQKALELLTEYGEDVSFALKDKDDAYAYEPLVPDDEHDLRERLLALKDWAGGYMTGLGITSVKLTKEEQGVIHDLLQIAAIRLDDDEELDDEELWLHLFEFARMVPVSLSVRQRVDVMSLPLIKGLDIHAKTAKEVANEKSVAFVDAMAQKQ
ncbi:UPF0149 family protein [Moraxella oculi]|uniref:UPF0149 family protein n=1 Tax=Moraxella oculi TaxID=2940516 RepID=A0ABW8UAQ3_9GAMM